MCDCPYLQNLLMQYAPPAPAAGQAGQPQPPPSAAAQAPFAGMQAPATAPSGVPAGSSSCLIPNAAEAGGRERLQNGTGQQQLPLQQGADSRGVSAGHQQDGDQQRPDAPALDLLAGAVAAVEAAGEQSWSPS